jgi:deoxyribose-phosphate aldolase
VYNYTQLLVGEEMELEQILNQVLDKVKEILPKNDFSKKGDDIIDAIPYIESEANMENQDFSSLSEEEIIEKMASFIDHTILKADATKSEVDKIVNEALEYKFCSVCVNSSFTSYVSQKLGDSGVKTCTVVGFPLGAMSIKSKAFEAKQAVEDGSDEIDMVINVGALKSKDFTTVLNDISAVVKASYPAVVKVIIETCLLNEEEKIIACTLSKTAGAHFVKTSTGFSTSGATVEDIALMRKMVGPNLGVKASGGVRDQKTAIAMIKAGASRVGASSSIGIVEG